MCKPTVRHVHHTTYKANSVQHPNIERYDTAPRATIRIISFLNYMSRTGSHVVVQANDGILPQSTKLRLNTFCSSYERGLHWTG